MKKETVDILIHGKTIVRIGKIKTSDKNFPVLDAAGRIVAPGFIDVHIQGAGGASILDAGQNALKTISRALARLGTTSFLATTVFKPGAGNLPVAIAAENTGQDLGGANLLGIHLEGPFVSPEKKGGILMDSICKPSLNILRQIYGLTGKTLKMMTVAPELTGSSPVIRKLVNSGAIASFGHSNASYAETLKGIKSGISHVTHLFNAMPAINHRLPGPLPAIFENKDITCQVITDGIHLSPEIVRFAFRLLGDSRFVTISDGLTSTGLPDGTYLYDGVKYQSKNGTARRDPETLVGTTLGLNRMIGRLMKFTGCPLESALKTVTEVPARALGIEKRKGSLTVGKDADIVILNQDLSVFATIVAGKKFLP
ncbi:MAG: N-acetylglucosamine-6-phosphate deacetylase [Candidatus Omnitrophica bacterium]|nr:N-acetylglucosamine-6-phosphate deacetylase [Candidatus Omnitrophota bacterium]